MEGNSTIVRIWWTIFTGAIQPSQRRPEKLESDRFEDTNTDFLLGTTASATWALPAPRGGMLRTAYGLGGAALALGAPRVIFCT